MPEICGSFPFAALLAWLAVTIKDCNAAPLCALDSSSKLVIGSLFCWLLKDI